jgi:hypothetical protein
LGFYYLLIYFSLCIMVAAGYYLIQLFGSTRISVQVRMLPVDDV